MKKKLLRIFFAFIMFFSVLPTQHIYNKEEKIIEAYDLKGYVYFEKPSTWQSGGVMFMVGHSSYSIGYLMTNISGTNIYYYNQSSTWGGATEFAFVDANVAWEGRGEKISSRVGSVKNYVVTSSVWELTGGYNIFTIDPSYAGSYTNSYNYFNISVSTSANTGGTAYVNGYGFTSATAASAAGSSKTTASIIKYTNATLTATANTGYTFKGWYDNASYTGNALSTNKSYTVENVTDAKTYYAKFTPNTYSVTLNNQSATTTGSTSVTATFDSAMPSITVPTKTGYTFGGYYTATGGSGTQYYNANGTSAKNWDKTSATTLFAKWTANTYTVTLNNQSATTAGTTSETATYASAMPSITVPTKTGYTFGGYFTGTNGTGTQYYNADGSSARTWNLTEATTLYAKWTVNTYTITLDSQEATNTGSTSVTATFDSAMPSIILPTKTGKIFAGYYSGEDGTGTQYYTSSGASAINWNIASDTTLYAYWINPVSHVLTLDLCGGTYNDSTNSISHTVHETLTYNLDQYEVTRTGYTFAGWYTTSDYTGDPIESNDIVSQVGAGNLSHYTLYAKWTANTYTVTLNNQSATTAGTEAVNPTYDSAMPSITVPTKTGYTFGGYFTGTNGTGTQYYNADGSSAKTWNLTEATTLYAKWTANTYTVTYDSNGGTGTINSSTHTYDTSKALTTNTFTRTGYTFNGWNTASDGSGDPYADGESVINLTATSNGNVTLYAQWTPITYSISYDLQGGSVNGSNLTNYNIETDSFTLTNPTKTGYTFTGWTGSNGNTPQATVTISQGSYGNKTYTANWEANTYTISFNLNYSTDETIDTINVTYNQPYGTLPTPNERTGYNFLGWTIYPSGSVVTVTSETIVSVAEDDTLYAIWEAKEYTVTLNANGGTCDITEYTATYNKTYDNSGTKNFPDVGDTNEPTRDGYTFVGWFTAISGGTQVAGNNKHQTDSDITLYAHWEVITYTINYNMQMDGVSTPAITSYTIETETFTLETPSKYGATFLGWTGSNGEDPQTTVTITQGSFGNKEYTAEWTGTITFHIDGEAYNTAKTGWGGTIEKESLYLWGNDGTYHSIDWNNDYNAENPLTRFVYDSTKKEHTYVVTLSTTEFSDITGMIFYFFQNKEMKQTKNISVSFNINHVGGHYEIEMPASFDGDSNDGSWKINNVTTVTKMTCITYMRPDGITILGEDYFTDSITEYRPIFVEQEGYKLVGWYEDIDLTKFFESGVNTISSAKTLYAKYVEAEDYYLYVDAREIINSTDEIIHWTPSHLYMWSDYFVNHDNGAWPGDNTEDIIIDLGNGMFQIKVDASKSFDNLILNDGGNKKTEDISLSPDNVYYIINQEKEYLEDDNQYRFTTTYEEKLDNLMAVQKVGTTNNFRFSAGLPDDVNIDTTVSKNFGYKFIFIDEDNNSYIGYWTFSTSNILDALRVGGTLYKSNSLDQNSTYDGFYALTLNSSSSFSYASYTKVVVVACYKENNSNNTNVIKAQEYNITVDQSGNVTLTQIER